MQVDRLHYVRAIDSDKPKDRFQKGRKFKARIRNITRDGVELEVEEGIMTARLETGTGFGIGDIEEFEITDRTDDRITLKHIKSDDNKKFDIRV